MAQIDKNWNLNFRDGSNVQDGGITPLNSNLLNAISWQIQGITNLLCGETVNFSQGTPFVTDNETKVIRFNTPAATSDLQTTAWKYYTDTSGNTEYISQKFTEVINSISTNINNAIAALDVDNIGTDNSLIAKLKEVDGRLEVVKSIPINELQLTITQISGLDTALTNLQSWTESFNLQTTGSGNVVSKVEYNTESNTITVTKTTLSREDINGLDTYFVAKDGEKVLSTNDYTTDEKNKLSKIADEATKVESSTNGKIKINGTDTTVYRHPDKHSIGDITNLETTLAGKQPSGDYATKSDAKDYATTAENNAIQYTSDIVGDIGDSTTVKKYVDEKVSTITGGTGSTTPTVSGLAADLKDHIDSTTIHVTKDDKTNWNEAYTHSQKTSGNPHEVTKSDVGLGNVVNTGDSATPVNGGTTKFTTGGAYTELAKKVDKVSGKGLSTNDLTATLKSNYDTAYTHSQAEHAPINAQPNQNAFSNVTIGGTTIAANTTTDTLTLIGSNVTLTPDATNDKLTIAITKDDVTTALGYTPPTSDTKYTLPTASTTKKGGIKVGDRLSISGETLSADKQAWDDITDKPTTFEPETHTHSVDDITNIRTTMQGVKVNNATSADKAISDANDNNIIDTYATKEFVTSQNYTTLDAVAQVGYITDISDNILFDEETKVVNTVGGFKVDDDLQNMTLKDILTKLLLTPVESTETAGGEDEPTGEES